MKKIVVVMMVLCFLLVGCSKTTTLTKTSTTKTKSISTTTTIKEFKKDTIAYIPLDDRPVNTTRAVYLAEASNINLVMPDIDLYRTRLDGQPLNNNGTKFGNIQELFSWLKNVECDYYVISLDQILSGGLVNSRISNTDIDSSLVLLEELFSIIGDKPAVLFDTVMRLASTVGYEGYNEDDYYTLREYSKKERKEASDIDSIVQSYELDKDSNLIERPLDNEKMDRYFYSRERKLRISEKLLELSKNKNNIYIYYGVDDSSPFKSIQTNEINYIKNNILNGTIFSGTDELGLMSISKILSYKFNESVKVKINYYGKKENDPADEYDTGTLKETINSHLASLNAVESNNPEVIVFVLTKPKINDQLNSYIKSLISDLKTCIDNKVPVILIDASTKVNQKALQIKLINEIDILMLLGYSNWNTVSNSVGIALSNGLSRYRYLKYDMNKNDECDYGFIRMQTFSFIKDMTYKLVVEDNLYQYFTDNIGPVSNFYTENTSIINNANEYLMSYILNKKTWSPNGLEVLNSLNNSSFITSLNEYSISKTKEISISDAYFPWYRTFEIDFKINIE